MRLRPLRADRARRTGFAVPPLSLLYKAAQEDLWNFTKKSNCRNAPSAAAPPRWRRKTTGRSTSCLDCGAHTADIRYASGDTRRDAAQRAAHLWNIGKVLSSNPGD